MASLQIAYQLTFTDPGTGESTKSFVLLSGTNVLAMEGWPAARCKMDKELQEQAPDIRDVPDHYIVHVDVKMMTVG